MVLMHDQLENGRSFKLLKVINDFKREPIGIVVDFSLSSARVVQMFKQITAWSLKP